MAKIIIIDYQLGNLFSVQNTCRAVGIEAVTTSDKHEIAAADGIILPGVGAFGDAMQHIHALDLAAPLIDFAQSGKPMMGICLGMQLLFSESEEFGTHKGLGIIDGVVKKFTLPDRKIRVPQIGWNTIHPPTPQAWDNTPLQNTPVGSYMYFVHSYYTIPHDQTNTLCLTTYEDITYCSAVHKKNIFAFQFHPERSAKVGVEVYKNWLSTIQISVANV
jgi:glutamine amidotransferase